MFKSPKVPCYVQTVTFDGKDEKKTVRFVFYVTPITPDLAFEVSEHLADRLFRKNGSEWQPAQEMPRVAFNLENIPVQSMTWHAVEDEALDHTGVLTQNVKLSSISAVRLYPEKPDFSLIFKADVPMDSVSVELARAYFHRTVCLTMEDMQGELFQEDQIGDSKRVCEECENPAIYEDSEHSFFCGKHVRAGRGEVKLIVRTETPAEAAARLEREATDNDAKQAGEDSGDAETGAFINDRNKRTRRNGKAAVN